MIKKKLTELIDFPLIQDDCDLVVVQSPNIPFNIKRIYYIISPVKNLSRGYHAHKKNLQVVLCLKGSVKMIIDNGSIREEIILSKPNKGIFLNKMIWHEMHEMDEDTILLVLASENFDEKDYIRNYGEFLESVRKK